MLDKEFVPYNESLELKELLFNEVCMAGYDGDDNSLYIAYISNEGVQYNPQYYTKAPLFSQAFRFFREKYNWQHSIDPTSDQHRFELGYNYWIWNNKTGEEYHTMPKNRPTGDWEYETYEEAELECLRELIKIVKNK